LTVCANIRHRTETFSELST